MSRYVIGLTGGIGSGKTTVSDLFADIGIVIADSDVASRNIVKPGRPAHTAIVEHFGESILLEDKNLNRARLREIVFSDTNERRWLESLTHGPIIQELKEIISAAKSAYSILVLSAGGGRSPLVNRMLVVDVPEEVQLARATERDGNNISQIKSIMKSQPTREERFAWADDIIENDGTIDELKRKVNALHTIYLAEAAKLL